MVPNLRQLVLGIDFRPSRSTHSVDSPFQFTHSTTKLEEIEDCGYCELTRQLAMPNMCSNLKSLELFFVNRPGLLSSDIIFQLKNMPVLEILTLIEFELELMDLERVHHNIPSIKCLSLCRVTIFHGQVPQDVIPSHSMTKLKLDLSDVGDLDTHIQLYKYLGKKYPSVSKPIIDDNTASSNGSDYARDVYINGILPFYQSHGSKIDSFFFSHYCDGLGAFRKFDISGIKLKQLKLQCVARNNPLFIEELVHSQQSKYIQKLVLKYVVPEPLAMVSHLEALTHLVISFQVKNYTIRGSIKPTIEFSQLINACPAALAHLTTKRVNFTFSESTLNTTSIQYMKLVDVDFTANTTITWTSFPELSHLYLKSIVSGCLTITLPRNHLKEASIDNKYQRDETCGFSAKAMNEDELKRSVIWSDGERGIGGRLCGPNKFDPGLEPDNMVYFTYASVEVLDYTITEMYYSDDDNE